MLKVFTWSSYLNDRTRKYVFPLLLDLYFDDNEVLKRLFKLEKNINVADIVIIPLDVSYLIKIGKKDELLTLISMAEMEKKPIWTFTGGDIGLTMKSTIYNFRAGGFNNKLPQRTFIIPALIQDPYLWLEKKNKVIDKSELPQIGFVGHANPTFLKYLKEYLLYVRRSILRFHKMEYDYQPFHASGISRYKLLKKLRENSFIKEDFIIRLQYRAGAISPKLRNRTSIEYFNNIERNPYTLCYRGLGNFSIRLYEVLAMGRIPVLVDSNCKLPLDWLDWRKHCIITTKENLEKDLISFHSSKTEESFGNFQKENRVFWEKYLTREGYFTELHEYFLKNIL
jgi:hypothetical protein